MKQLNVKTLAAILVAPLVLPSAGQAGDSWLSKVRPHTHAPTGAIDSAPLLVAPAADNSASIFDVVISLEANPQGDDDAEADVTGDEEQRKYEAVIGEFADAVCQSTNTAHTLGVVRIFRNFEQKDAADILWNETCALNQGPRANPSGFGKSGQHIYTCDNWPGAGGFDPLLDNPVAAGYTLAHEWGHYAYGLYDEYASGASSGPDYLPRGTDTVSSPSIMHNQWCAAGGACPAGFTTPDADFLEFSTDQVAPFSGSGTNAQERIFGKSGWDVLLQDTDDDPKCLTLFGTTFGNCIPSRTRYTSLSAVSPPSSGDYTVNDDEANCRDNLDIRWMLDDVINELVLDRSGSMAGTKIANAKTAANLLIDQLRDGSSAVGVASFAGDVLQNFAIADIPDPDTGVKTAAQGAVSSLDAVGSTALFDALNLGLNNALAFANASSNPNRASVVFALSDGEDNSSSVTEGSVTAAYQAADVPIISFGFGSGAPIDVLRRLASQTGGEFFLSPTTLAEIQRAFTAANAAVSSSAILTDSAQTAPALDTIAQTLAVDSSIGEALIALTYTGAVDDISIVLRAPDGGDTSVVFDCQAAAGSTTCIGEVDGATIAAFGNGDYEIEIANVNTTDVLVNVIVTAIPLIGGDTYDVAIATTGGATVTYPQEARVTATVTRRARIAGLVAAAEVTDPNGVTSQIDLFDDGTNGDGFAEDGTYTALIPYTQSGTHIVRVTVDNANGTATETTAGELISHTADGSPLPPPGPTVLVAENFTRSATTQFTTVDVQADDHANDVNGGNCTVVSDNNADTSGRIDFAADVDCFAVVPSDPASNLVFRVNGFSSGMNAVLTVFDSTGVQIATVDLGNSDNPDGGVIATIESPDPAGMRFSVVHVNADATAGGYTVSAGPSIVSDGEPPARNARARLRDIADALAPLKSDRRIRAAIHQLEHADAARFWNDDGETLTRRGAGVFRALIRAVSHLSRGGARADTVDAAKMIAVVARDLAQTALERAPSKRNPRLLRIAKLEFKFAEELLAKHYLRSAIQHFKRSWRFVQRASH